MSPAKPKPAPKSASKSASVPAAAPVAAFSRPPKRGDHVFLVDGSSYIFRAYHALPPLTRKSDGLQVNAVLGFCNMLWKLLRDMKPEERPTHLAVIFDKSERTFRNEMYPDYKAHRPDAPDDLIPQFPLVREAVLAFDLPSIEQLGFEADDLIATYVRQACEVGASATIVSSDKDLMQLVNDGVMMYDTMKDRRIGRAEVIEKFGVPPEKVIEVQALIGDSTDNVPGVPGIGVKTAAQLITEYGDLETLLARAGEIKQEKRRQSLVDNAELARLSKKLVTLDDRVKLDVPLADLAVHEPDYRRLVGFLKAMEFSSLIRRVSEFSGVEAAEIDADERLKVGHPPPDRPAPAGAPAPASPERKPKPAAPGQVAALPGDITPQALAAARAEAARSRKIDRKDYKVLRTLPELEAWLTRAADRGVLAIACQTSSIDPMQATLCGFALALASGEAGYVPLAHRQGGEAAGEGLFAGGLLADQIAESAALAALKPILEDASVLKVGHNVKFERAVLAQRGIEMAPIDDIMLISYALDAGRAGHGTAELSERYLGHTTIDINAITGSGKSKLTFDCVAIEKAAEYAAEDADVVLRLWRLLKPRLTAEHMNTVYETLERPLVPVLARMERRGISIDRQVLSRLSGEFAQRALALEDEIQKLAGEPINPGSPKQLGDILFGKFGLPGGTKTKTGQWSTGARALEELAEQGHPLPQKILDWRQVSKLRSTYTDALPGYVNPQTHRLHTTYALAATPTGRLSSSEPNLQNIPVRTEEGRKIRRAFVAAPGHKLASADYSQIELRLLAAIADIAPLKKAFRDGLDIHAMTASEMFGVPVKDMPGEVRRRAKAINFGIIYGISAFGLANQLGIAREEAGAYIKKYFERFPGIRDYMEETKAFCKQNGYVLTLFGRKCHYPDIVSSNASIRSFNERAAINARLQGTAADIIRRAMIRMDEALEKEKLNAQMLLQVHDELVFEVPDDEVANTLPVVKKVMEHAPMPALDLSVPLAVDARAADNWDEAH
ncbi:MAG TPA: DNA polymerase I [Xanthobacteraceae bacterium]|jgi:DNA polymerase-1|nr:DNA polymerase I [Xanthobacteraceae bacterium]